jgi:hypothetical protein
MDRRTREKVAGELVRLARDLVAEKSDKERWSDTMTYLEKWFKSSKGKEFLRETPRKFDWDELPKQLRAKLKRLWGDDHDSSIPERKYVDNAVDMFLYMEGYFNRKEYLKPFGLKYFLNIGGTPENVAKKSKKIRDFVRGKHIDFGVSSVNPGKHFIDVWREKENEEFVKFLNKLKEKLPLRDGYRFDDINWSTSNWYK